MALGKKLFNLFANIGDWIIREVKKKDSAIVLGILSVIYPIGFVFTVSLIVSIYRKRRSG